MARRSRFAPVTEPANNPAASNGQRRGTDRGREPPRLGATSIVELAAIIRSTPPEYGERMLWTDQPRGSPKTGQS